MAAVLSCGSRAVRNHESAALWEIRTERRRVIEVSVPPEWSAAGPASPSIAEPR
jgi:hypothetical protein